MCKRIILKKYCNTTWLKGDERTCIGESGFIFIGELWKNISVDDIEDESRW